MLKKQRETRLRPLDGFDVLQKFPTEVNISFSHPKGTNLRNDVVSLAMGVNPVPAARRMR